MNKKNPFMGMFGPNQIDIPPGESRYIGFGAEWRKDKKEVKLFFGDCEEDVITLTEEIIKEHGYPVLIVAGENIDPIRIELIPDFDKQEILTREVLDINEKKKFTGDNDVKLSFEGIIKKS